MQNTTDNKPTGVILAILVWLGIHVAFLERRHLHATDCLCSICQHSLEDTKLPRSKRILTPSPPPIRSRRRGCFCSAKGSLNSLYKIP